MHLEPAAHHKHRGSVLIGSLNCKAVDLHVFLDGVDITKSVIWGELKVAFEKKMP